MRQSTLDLSYVRVVATVESNLATKRERQKTLFTTPAIFPRSRGFSGVWSDKICQFRESAVEFNLFILDDRK